MTQNATIPTPDRSETIALLQSLIRIDSRNPDLVPRAPGEAELARHVAEMLTVWGWIVDVEAIPTAEPPKRCNVIARLPDTKDAPTLVINVHLDTVGVDGMEDPFGAALRDGKVFGRGAQDTKGGMAAVLAMAQMLAESQPQLAGNVVLALVADEEHASLGTEAFLRTNRADAAIVIEPSDLQVCIGHRGYFLVQIETRGRMAHGGRSRSGVDANRHMGHVLVELDALDRLWRKEYHHPGLDSAALHVPLISGGRQLFMVSDVCRIDVECRTIPGQTRTSILDDLQGILDRCAEQVPDFDASLEPGQWRAPFSIDPKQPIVEILAESIRRVRGANPELITHGWWEDSGLMHEAGIDTVVIGPTGAGIHEKEEWVDPDSVVDLARILYDTCCSFCR